jgi:hypothetical protein
MIKLLTGTSRHEADPFHSICWMPCEMWPEGRNAIAVTEPTSARRRVSDLAEFVYNGRILPEWRPGCGAQSDTIEMTCYVLDERMRL